MELLSNPKAVYLLEANLEVLHEESREWLNEISFWRDEIAFFYTMMIKRTGKDFALENKEEISHIQEEILLMSGKEFSELEISINQHESYLASLLENNLFEDERAYRQKHKTIFSMIKNFDVRVRRLKQEIFSLVRKNHH